MNKLYVLGVLLAGFGWWAATSPPDLAAREDAIRKHVQPRIDRNQVQAQLHRVRTALYQYNAESGEVPVGFDEIVATGILRWADVTDPWGNRFAFRSEKKASNAFMEEYEIFVYSLGPDGTPDNADDIYI